MSSGFLFLGIILYFFMGIVMYRLGQGTYHDSRLISTSDYNKKSLDTYFILSLLFYALMCGIRFRVGKDCESYAEEMEGIRSGHDLLLSLWDEPLYELIVKFFLSIGGSRVLFLGFLAFIEIVFYYSALRSRSFLLPFVGLALMMGFHFQEWNNGIRQIIASCIFFYALVGLIDNGKRYFARFYIWLFVAFLIHKSSVMLFPLSLLVFYNKKPQIGLSLGVLLVAFIIGRSAIPVSVFDGADDILSLIGYENYSDKLDYYFELESKIKRYGPRRISLFFTYVLIILYSKKMDTFYKSDQFYRVAFLLFMVYAGFTEALLSMRGIFSRPFLFFMPYFLLMSGYLLYYLKFSKNKVMFWVAIVMICSYSILSCIAEYNSPEENVVYKLIFFHS